MRDAALHVAVGIAFAIGVAWFKGGNWRFPWAFAVAYAAFVVAFTLARRRNVPARRVGGWIALRPSARVTAVVAGGMAALVIGFAVSMRYAPPDLYWPFVAMFVVLIAWIGVAMRRWSIRVGPDRIESRPGLARITAVRWSAVTAIESFVRTQKGFSHEFIRVIAGHTKIDVPCSFDGAEEFARLALENVAPEVLDRDSQALAMLRSLTARGEPQVQPRVV